MYGDGYMHGFGGMWFGPLLMWGLPLLLLFLVGWWLLNTRSDSGGPRRRNEARAVLDERLARGEIDEEEYRRLRGALES